MLSSAWVAGLVILLPVHKADAQTLPSAGAAPGAILQHNVQPWNLPTDKPLQPGQPSNEIPQRELNTPPSPVLTETEPQTMAPDSRLVVFIEKIRVEGNTLLDDRLVEATIQHYQGKNLRFSDMEEISDKLTDLYIQAGYINTQVYIPVQDFANHQLLLKVLEAKVGEVSYEPAQWFPKRGVTPRIALQKGDFVNVNVLSRSIRLINDNPDLNLQAHLVKGKETGTTNVVLQGQSRFPLHVTPFIDNLGRDSIGNLRLGVSTTDNNLLGFGDTDTNVVSFTRRSFGIVNQYSFPIGPYGTRIGMNYAYSNVRLGGSLKPLDIQSRSHIFTPLIEQTFFKTDRFGLNAQLAFDFKNLNTDLLGQTLYQDRLRVLRPGLEGYVNDRWGRTYFNQDMGLGLDILGGSVGDTSLASKRGAGTKFVNFTGGLTRVQKLPFNTTGIIRGRYQYSPDRLLSAEQLQIGGSYTVRGYMEGRQLGDSGYFLNGEWYIPAFILPKSLVLPFTGQPLRQAVQLVTFTDFGQSFTNRSQAGEWKRATMLSCGIGLRVQLNRLLVGRLDVGFPLLRQPSDELKPRLHVGLQSTLF